MDWNTINYKKLFGEEKTFDLSKYEMQKPKKNNPTYELRKKIALIVGKPIGQILGKTKGWSELELNGCIIDSIAFVKNPAARCWNIIKEINKKHEKN